MTWKAASVMTRDVVAVTPGIAYKEIVERIRERGVSAVPVVDAERRVVGIVSEADLLLKEEQPAPGLGEALLHTVGIARRMLAFVTCLLSRRAGWWACCRPVTCSQW